MPGQRVLAHSAIRRHAPEDRTSLSFRRIEPPVDRLLHPKRAFEALIRQATLGPGEPRGRHELYGPAVQRLLCALMEQEGAYRRRMDLYSLFADWPHLSPAVIDEIMEELIVTDHVRTTSPATVEQMHSILTAGGALPNLAKTLEERIGDR